MPHLKRGSRCISEPLARLKRQCQFVWAARVVIVDVWCRDPVRGHARMPKITKRTLHPWLRRPKLAIVPKPKSGSKAFLKPSLHGVRRRGSVIGDLAIECPRSLARQVFLGRCLALLFLERWQTEVTSVTHLFLLARFRLFFFVIASIHLFRFTKTSTVISLSSRAYLAALKLKKAFTSLNRLFDSLERGIRLDNTGSQQCAFRIAGRLGAGPQTLTGTCLQGSGIPSRRTGIRGLRRLAARRCTSRLYDRIVIHP